MVPRVFVAGTFDDLHKGHESLLAHAFAEGDRVTIGLTSDAFIARYKIPPFAKASGGRQNPPRIQPFEKRKQVLLDWIAEKGFSTRATVVPIDDPYEPAASGVYDALIVTAHNRARGEEINAMRRKRGLPPLTLIEVPLLGGEDKQPISSTRVRMGEIDRTGRLVMPDTLRPELKAPLGMILRTPKDIEESIEKSRIGPLVVTVGDMAAKTLLAADMVPDMAIVDGKIMRTPVADFADVLAQFSRVIAVESGPGFIAHTAVEEIRKSIEGPKGESIAINVAGEEDLLVLPVITEAPAGAVIYYGQPREGLVEVVVTEAKKEEVAALLGKFT